MLDKSVPYIDVLMRRKQGTPVPRFDLPIGYRFRLYNAGDEMAWSAIEASVLEFSSEFDACLYFTREYVPLTRELERRCLFVETTTGEKVATATAFWSYSGIRRDPWLHWVAVKPKYQGLGLGKALISKAISLMLDIEGDRDFYLHTQTWSHKAIKIYKKVGFCITNDPDLGGYKNDKYEQAIKLLKELDDKSISSPSKRRCR